MRRLEAFYIKRLRVLNSFKKFKIKKKNKTIAADVLSEFQGLSNDTNFMQI